MAFLRRLMLLGAIPLFFLGCGKSTPPGDSGTSATIDTPQVERNDPKVLVGKLKGSQSDRLLEAISTLALAKPDPATTIPLLLEALQDSTSAPLGETYDERPTSTREAVVIALMNSGDAGKKALLETGLRTLEQGLKDSKPAVREHTVNAVGMIGPEARALTPLVATLASDSQKEVRTAAYRALKRIGNAPVSQILKLLRNPDPGIASDAAESLTWMDPSPSDVPVLLDALKIESTEQLSPDEVAYIRNAVAESLGKVGKEKAIPALIDLLIKSEEAQVAKMFQPNGGFTGPILALRRIGRPAVPEMAKLLKHKEPLVRYQAAAVLEGIGDAASDASADVLTALAAERNLPNGQMYVFEGLTLAATRLGGNPQKITDNLIELLKSDMEPVRYRAAQLVRRMGRPASTATPALIDILQTTSPKTQIVAIEALGAIGTANPLALDELIKMVSHEEVDVARAAVAALKPFGPKAKGAVVALTKALDSNDPSLATEAAEALGHIGPDAATATPTLLKHLTNPRARNDERLAYLGALAAIGPKAKEATVAVAKLTQDNERGIQFAAIRTLGKIGDGQQPEARKTLMNLVKGSNLTARYASLRSLGEMGPVTKSLAPEIKDYIDKSTDPGLKIWGAAALTAMEVGMEANSQVVLEALKPSKELPTRLVAAEAIDLLGDKSRRAVPDLLDLLKLKSARTGKTPREIALNALKRLGPKAHEAVPALIELLRDPDRTTRSSAIEVLGNIGPQASAALPKLKELATAEPALEETISIAISKIEPVK
jgi:HEAT repeat protein